MADYQVFGVERKEKGLSSDGKNTCLENDWTIMAKILTRKTMGKILSPRASIVKEVGKLSHPNLKELLAMIDLKKSFLRLNWIQLSWKGLNQPWYLNEKNMKFLITQLTEVFHILNITSCTCRNKNAFSTKSFVTQNVINLVHILLISRYNKVWSILKIERVIFLEAAVSQLNAHITSLFIRFLDFFDAFAFSRNK